VFEAVNKKRNMNEGEGGEARPFWMRGRGLLSYFKDSKNLILVAKFD
jgi:hypothetical protein